MLLRTEKLVSKFFSKRIFLKNVFCHVKPHIQSLHLKKQTAELSLEIYHLILRKPNYLDLQSKSLHDLIMEKIYQKDESKDRNISGQSKELHLDNKDADTFRYHEEARKPFIDLFENGYQIDPEIFRQQRINTGKIEDNEQKKFIFHPTYLITNQVFRDLHMLFNGKKNLAGHYGISKTVAVCLFWHLAKFIDEYRYQEGITASKQMMRVPKVFYYSLGLGYQNYVKKIILKQCPEIIRQDNLTNATQFNWQDFVLMNFYLDNYPNSVVIMVIDQFNQIAQLGKVYQQYIEDTQKIGLILDNNKKKEVQKNVDFFFKLKKNIEFCLGQFQGVLGLSPIDIQQQFFKKQIVFATQTNSLVPRISWVKYSSEFYKPQSLAQIVDYFIFEMNQRIFKNLKNVKVSKENQKEMKKICFDYLTERFQKQEYFFFTPLDIAYSISKQEISTFDQPINQKKKLVKNKLSQIANFSIQKYQKKLQEHFDKKGQKIDNEKRIKLIFSIYNHLIFKLDNQSSQSITYISLTPSQIRKFSSIQIEQFLDKRLFRYKQQDKLIELMLPSKFLVQIMKPSLRKYIEIYVKDVLQQIRANEDNQLVGKHLESAFVQTLTKGKIKFSFNLKNLETQGDQYRHKFQIQDKIFTFQKLQQTTKNQNLNPVSLLDRFKQTIQQMKNKNKNYAVAFPVKKNFQKDSSQQQFIVKDLVKNSKSIDLALISNNKSNNLIRIWLIDLTISRDLIRPKIQNFISQFLKFSDNNVSRLYDIQDKPSIQINYAVFGPQNGIEHSDFKDVLETKYGKQIKFKTLQESNAFTVEKINNSESCLLKRIAYIDLNNDFKFLQAYKQKNRHLALLNQIFQKI